MGVGQVGNSLCIGSPQGSHVHTVPDHHSSFPCILNTHSAVRSIPENSYFSQFGGRVTYFRVSDGQEGSGEDEDMLCSSNLCHFSQATVHGKSCP
jgi:hypothetical protein